MEWVRGEEVVTVKVVKETQSSNQAEPRIGNTWWVRS
jgi:hypothetical protein